MEHLSQETLNNFELAIYNELNINDLTPEELRQALSWLSQVSHPQLHHYQMFCQYYGIDQARLEFNEIAKLHNLNVGATFKNVKKFIAILRTYIILDRLYKETLQREQKSEAQLTKSSFVREWVERMEENKNRYFDFLHSKIFIDMRTDGSNLYHNIILKYIKKIYLLPWSSLGDKT
jgi:hypothetical protein